MKNRVQEYRWKRGWSVQQLARISKVNRSTIVRLEDGSTKSPSLDVAFALADALKAERKRLLFLLFLSTWDSSR